MEFRDYYAVLGVAKQASAEDIKRAYRKLARQFHPDVNPGDQSAEVKFKEINEAHEVLGDPEKRRKYDELGANWRAYEQQAPSGDASRGAWRASGGTYRTISPDELQDLFGRGDPFSDFFYTFFGGGGGSAFGNEAGRSARSRTAPRARRGSDVETRTDLTLEEVFAGTTRRVQMAQGDRPRTLDVRIPAGVPDGARVRASGEGAPGSGNAAAGDLYLVVRVLPHARFDRKGQDLQTRVPVPVTTAVLGGEATVSTLGGTTLRLKIPPLTSTGRVFRLRGHGLPVVGRPDERGDLFATIDVAVPSTLSDEERAHYEALKGLAGKEDRS